MARILLVEDDDDVRILLEQVLIEAGYEVDSTATIAEATSLLDALSYELVLADARLPDGSGVTLAGQAQESGSKTLVLTGYAFQLSERERDSFEVLCKPIRAADLLAAIERSLTAPQV